MGADPKQEVPTALLTAAKDETQISINTRGQSTPAVVPAPSRSLLSRINDFSGLVISPLLNTDIAAAAAKGLNTLRPGTSAGTAATTAAVLPLPGAAASVAAIGAAAAVGALPRAVNLESPAAKTAAKEEPVFRSEEDVRAYYSRPGATAGISRMDSSFSRYGRAAEVMELQHNSPAEKAGLKVGDKILYADGRNVTEGFSVDHLLFNKTPGEKLKLDISRGGKRQTIDVTLGQPYGRLGLEAKSEVGFWGGESNEGVRIVRVDQRLKDLGIKPKETITGVDGKEIHNLMELSEAIEKHTKGDKVSLKIKGRDGALRDVSVALDGKPVAVDHRRFQYDNGTRSL